MESIASLPTSTSSSTRKRRRAITDAEKKAIRDWWAAASPEQKSHKKLRAWFQETHYHTISQSSISEILSDRYERLDKSTAVEFAGKKRDRASKWPDLESALNEWQIRMNRKGATITGYILKEMVDKFWDSLPQYSTLERPHWSDGWLTAFKQRHHIKQKMRHGESAGVDRMQLELELAELRTFLSDYDLDDIYNVDETGLFWKLLPDRTLASDTST